MRLARAEFTVVPPRRHRAGLHAGGQMTIPAGTGFSGPYVDKEQNHEQDAGCVIAIASVVLGASVVIAQQNPPAPAAPIPAGLPEWAYTPPPPAGSPPPPSRSAGRRQRRFSIAGTDKTMTRGALRGVKEIPDWYPGDRQRSDAAIVRDGKEGVRACGFCHLADGTGRPENAPVNSLHVAYFIQQMQDYKNGLRKSADPRKKNTNNMIAFAKEATDEEIKAAAEYFAAPALPEAHQGHRVAHGPEGASPGRDAHGDPQTKAAAWSRSATRSSRCRTTTCAPRRVTRTWARPRTCRQGAQQGQGARREVSVHHLPRPEPGRARPRAGLAGRSPSYMMRQLFDMKVGARRGPWFDLMKPIVDSMSVQDLLALSAYAGSVAPPARRRARHPLTCLLLPEYSWAGSFSDPAFFMSRACGGRFEQPSRERA